ncbi:MAG: hypothetical protein EOO67_07865, partial [Microbacterium sp.]
MATTTHASPSVRSTAQIPVRRGTPVQTGLDTQNGRIALAWPRPSVPGGRFAPSAFVGEAVPFQIAAFREGDAPVLRVEAGLHGG